MYVRQGVGGSGEMLFFAGLGRVLQIAGGFIHG